MKLEYKTDCMRGTGSSLGVGRLNGYKAAPLCTCSVALCKARNFFFFCKVILPEVSKLQRGVLGPILDSPLKDKALQLTSSRVAESFRSLRMPVSLLKRTEEQ